MHDLMEMKSGMQAHYKLRKACGADCGEQNPEFKCSKCKVVREYFCVFHCGHADMVVHKGYCSPTCQLEDWKVRTMGILIPSVQCSLGPQYHKTYCGTEKPILKDYL